MEYWLTAGLCDLESASSENVTEQYQYFQMCPMDVSSSVGKKENKLPT